MKRIIVKIVLAIAAISSICACTTEEFDTLVEWGFAKDANSEVSNGLETLLSSAATILNAFDTAFYSDYTDIQMSHEAIMKSQKGKSEAIKNAKKTAEKAHSMIGQDHVCPVDGVFVVRIKYNSDRYETVWSHDYRAK